MYKHLMFEIGRTLREKKGGKWPWPPPLPLPPLFCCGGLCCCCCCGCLGDIASVIYYSSCLFKTSFSTKVMFCYCLFKSSSYLFHPAASALLRFPGKAAVSFFYLLNQQDEQVPTRSLNHCINNSHNRGLAQPCS